MKSKNFLFLIICLIGHQLTAQVDGIWHTSFTVMGKALRMDMEVTDSNGVKTIFLSDPDKPSKQPFQVAAIEVSDTLFIFNWKKGGLNFEGKLTEEKDTIKGEMSQNGVEWEAVFTRAQQEAITIQRPQEPKAPFPYQTQEVTIPHGEHKITGTLTTPPDSLNKNIVVVLASGSGPQNRDGELLGHKPFWVIADYLARNGISTLRFDDRGTGGSTAGYFQASLFDFASDVSQCVDFIALEASFADFKIGVIGHSEGGMHALIAASKNDKIDFIIELASVGLSGKEVLLEQQYLIPLKSGLGEEHAKWNQSLFKGVCNIVEKVENKEKAGIAISDFIDRKWNKAPEKVKESSSIMTVKMSMNMLLNNDWGREFLEYQTKDYFSQCHVPVFAINGGEDIQVPAASNNKAFLKWMKQSKNKNSEAVILPGLNHLFQHCQHCNIEEYATIEETFTEEVMQRMVEWITLIGQ
jgi:pimeloyl-ACP methyl ester carboxylesterase